MFVFIDFEASSLGKMSYPIEVAWVFEDGQGESFLIQPAPHWTDWDPDAQAIHGIALENLHENGTKVESVAQHMIDQLSGHDLFASAPSWDGKWLSALLRAAKRPRHALRLRDTEEAREETAKRILSPAVPADQLHVAIADLLALVEVRHTREERAHRAFSDARDEYLHWREVASEATAIAERAGAGG